MKKVSITYLWKDRKRVLGMPLSFTRYRLSEDRIFLEVGFFNMKQEEALLYRVRDLSLSRSLWQRIFGVGTVKPVSYTHLLTRPAGSPLVAILNGRATP